MKKKTDISRGKNAVAPKKHLVLGMHFQETSYQWRIKDFQEGAPTAGESAQTFHFTNFLPKTAWKLKNLDRNWGCACAPLDPPLHKMSEKYNGWSNKHLKQYFYKLIVSL